MEKDRYSPDPASIKDPPSSFRSKLAFLGPGFILSASIVGSGELIATTILGAKAGFVAFWVIIVSCVIKVAIQLEFGRTAIINGESPMKLFSGFSGKNKWAVWVVFLLTLLKVIQIGGMLGGSALILYLLYPDIPVTVYVILLGFVVALLIYKNYYRLIERSSLLMVALFTVLTLVSLISVSFTEFRFSIANVIDGLKLHLPPGALLFAIGAFGITGVASDEIIAYNYWCIEKGYASYTGTYDNTTEWRKRAEGWIRVMRMDALFAMIIYTLVTAAFYLLGASILHNAKFIPEGSALISLIADIYTKTLGEGVKLFYLVGAFFVLFSSVFATLAYWTRLFTDIFGQFGWINFSRINARKRTVAILAWTLPVTWILAYFFIRLPSIMILSGGFVGSVLLLVVCYAAIYFRYKKNAFMPKSISGDVFLWISVISIFVLGLYGILEIVRQFLI
jgi:Mn2+/Fe2+ NRAMP family transporter